MEERKKYNRQIEINNLIDDAITNAVTRRGLVEISDDEAASVGGGLRVRDPKTSGLKPIDLERRSIKPVRPEIIGLIALPDKENLLSS